MSDEGMNAAILEAARAYLGLQEWPGAKSNPEVERLWAQAGMPVQTDEVAWCAAFVGAVLGSLGIAGTGKPNARSYLNWGRKVSQAEARPGDVVVFWRGSPSGWQGHVGFLVRFDGDRVITRGGNQSDKVTDSSYTLAQVLGYRRADVSLPVTGRATVRRGDRGAMVVDLQDQLRNLGYFTGKVDGRYGPLTDAAVRAFQADHGLSADGIVGPKTWEAMQDAPARPERDVSADDLRAAGSRTITEADKVTGAGAVVGVGGVIGAVAQADTVVTAAEGARSLIERTGTVLSGIAPWVLLLIVGILLFLWARRIVAARVDDARKNRNLAR